MNRFEIRVRPWRGWLSVETVDISPGEEQAPGQGRVIDITLVKADQTEYAFIAAAIARAMQRHVGGEIEPE